MVARKSCIAVSGRFPAMQLFFPALQFFFPALQFPGRLPATVGRGTGGDTLSNEIVVLPLLQNAFLELRSHKMLGIIRRQCGAWYFATGVGEQSLLIILLGTLGILRLQQFLAIPHSIDVVLSINHHRKKEGAGGHPRGPTPLGRALGNRWFTNIWLAPC